MGNSLWWSPEDEQIATTRTNFYYWLFSILAKNSMQAWRVSLNRKTLTVKSANQVVTPILLQFEKNFSWKLTRDGIKWQIAFQMFFASPLKRRKYKTTNLVIIRAASPPSFSHVLWSSRTRGGYKPVHFGRPRKKALSNNRWPLMLATTTI